MDSLSTHVSLIAMARQENLSAHFAREGSSTVSEGEGARSVPDPY